MWVFSGAAELCLLSLLQLGAGLAVVEPLAGVCFCASSCGLSAAFLPQLPLGGYANFSGSSCLSCTCGGTLSVGFAGSLVRRLVFHLVPCSSSGACGFGQLPLPQVALWGLCLFCHRIPGLLLRWWLRLGCSSSLVFSVLLLRRLGFARFCTLCQGAPIGVVTALWVAVMMVPYGSPAPRAFLLALSSSPAVLNLCGCCALFTAWFPLP